MRVAVGDNWMLYNCELFFCFCMSLQFASQEKQVGQSAWGPSKHFDRLPDLMEVGLQRGEGNI